MNMSLTLTVLSFKNQPINEIDSVLIGNAGGGIGRSDDNALVLPDTEKFVSRHHAMIRFENGGYYLSDTSLGGVYMSNREAPLHNATERIADGMILRVGEYEIAVAITDESVTDDFPFAPEPKPKAFFQTDEPWVELEDVGFNSLMTDNFPRHEELVQTKTDTYPAAFESGLQVNHSPLFDSYIAPGITLPPAIDEIPENFSFDDFFSESDSEIKTHSQLTQAVNKPMVDDDFDDFFGAAISNMEVEADQLAVMGDTPTENNNETSTVEESPAYAIEPPFSFSADKPVVTMPETDSGNEFNRINTENVPITEISLEKIPRALAGSVLFDAFLQGAVIECNEIRPEQQAETLHRIGQMFRKLIDGTVAVLRSRAEFKSLCRVNMTVIRAANNNPLKFTVSTDDVLRQLIENKTDGFLSSTTAIEESFSDIMNHQLAMQAGIQASLTDLLKTFDPEIIEKQFEQGLVLQKKSKCWDRYEETYRNTVEDAVENFFGDEFVKAYEKQMSLLTNARRK